MGKKEQSDFGKQIESLVQNAIDTLDFDQLSSNIGRATEKWNQELEKTVQPSIQKVKQEISDLQKGFVKKYKQNQPTELTVPVYKKTALKVKGILYTVFSSIGIAFFGIMALGCGMLGWQNPTLIFSIATLISLYFLNMGIRDIKKYNRMLRYIQFIKRKGFIEIQEIERVIFLKKEKIVKEIKEMLIMGMLPEGHLDINETYLFGTDFLYEQHCNTQKELLQRQQREEEERIRRNELSTEQQFILTEIEEGKKQIAEIQRLNDALPGPVISEKLYRLEKISEKIFLYVEKHPEQIEEIQRLKNYYLPTTLKLVNAYHRIQEEETVGDNMKKMCVQIEDTLDTMNDALEKMYTQLYEDEVLDVTSDISVLKTMLAREGLVENEWKQAREDKNNE